MTHWTAFIPSPDLSPLVESAFRGLLLAGLVAALLAVLRVRNVVAQKTAWLSVLLCACAMPLLFPLALRLPMPDSATAHLFLHRTQRITATTVATPITPTITEFRTVEHIGPVTDADDPIAPAKLPRSGNAPSSGPGASISPTALPQAPPTTPLVTRALFLLLLYAAVCATLLFRLVHGAAVAVRLWRASEPVDAALVAPFVDSIPVRSSFHVACPINIGSGILLPTDYATWDGEKLSIVLAHEASHVRQRDFYLQILANLYAVIFWFSPLGWWMQRRLSDLSEAISDHAGLQKAASPASYAQLLLQFAAQPRLSNAGVAMARTPQLSRRIERLLNESSFRDAFSATRIRTAGALLLIPVAVFAATALVRVQAAAQTQQSPEAVAPAQVPEPRAAVPDAAKTPQQAPAATPASPAPAPQPEPSVVAVTPPAIQLTTPVSPAPSATLSAPRIVNIPAIPAIKIHAQVPRIDVDIPPMPAMQVAIPALPPLPPEAMLVQMGKGAGFGKGSGDSTTHHTNNATSYTHERDGQFYGLFERHGGSPQYTGSWTDGHIDAINQAEKLAHGDFLLFTNREGKSYYIDDPQSVARVESIYDSTQHVVDPGQVEARVKEAMARAEENLKQHPPEVKAAKLDLHQQLADLSATIAKLQAESESVITPEQMADLQRKLGELQGKLMQTQIQDKIRISIDSDLAKKMADLASSQGYQDWYKSGLARAAELEMKSIIDQALKNGTAKPIQ